MASGGGGGGSAPANPIVRYAFTFPGSIDTASNAKLPWLPGQGNVVSQATGQVESSPAGADIEVEILLIKRVDGSTTSVLGTLAIAIGNLIGNISFSPAFVDSDHALAISVTQVGSISAGSTLSIVVT
jgi:hypothetical protein